MNWLLIIFSLAATFNTFSEAIHQKKLPSAVVVGTVYCDTCFQQDIAKNSHFISGATVAVECKDNTSRLRFRREEKTDRNGEFKVQLPFSVSKKVKKIGRCSVKLISSSESDCAAASRATTSILHLKSSNKEQIFSAGFFSFKPINQPAICNKKPSTQNSNHLYSKKILMPNIEASKTAKLSDQKETNSDAFFPPNPFQPPPLFPPIFPQPPPLFPPIFPQPPPLFPPIFPQPPPLIPPIIPQPPPLFPPILPPFLQPPPSPLIPLPPFPFLHPPPPPPPLFPPILPPFLQPPPSPLIPLPPFPFLHPPPPPPPTFPFPIPPFPPLVPGKPPVSPSSSSLKKPSP